MVVAVSHVCFFFLSDSRIVSHSLFACNWQNRFLDNEPVVARFPSNKGGSHSKPPFFNYIKPYIVAFQNTQKILRENTRFTRNSESKRDFSQNVLKSMYFLLRPFLALIFEFQAY